MTEEQAKSAWDQVLAAGVEKQGTVAAVLRESHLTALCLVRSLTNSLRVANDTGERYHKALLSALTDPWAHDEPAAAMRARAALEDNP